MYSWWWVRLSPETCRVKPLRIKNAIVASCWTYFTTIKHDARNHKYKVKLVVHTLTHIHRSTPRTSISWSWLKFVSTMLYQMGATHLLKSIRCVSEFHISLRNDRNARRTIPMPKVMRPAAVGNVAWHRDTVLARVYKNNTTCHVTPSNCELWPLSWYPCNTCSNSLFTLTLAVFSRSAVLLEPTASCMLDQRCTTCYTAL